MVAHSGPENTGDAIMSLKSLLSKNKRGKPSAYWKKSKSNTLARLLHGKNR